LIVFLPRVMSTLSSECMAKASDHEARGGLSAAARAALSHMDVPPHWDGQIIVQSTFLAVRCIPEAPVQQRAASAPPMPGSHDCDREEGKLCSLTYKTQPVNGPISSTGTSFLVEARPYAGERPSLHAFGRNGLREDVALSESTATPDGDSASEGTSFGLSARRSISIEALSSQDAITPVSTTLEADVNMESIHFVQPGIALHNVPRDMYGCLTSIGSIGHAQGLCKPCVFAHHASKVCMNGFACDFCHFDHAPKRRKQPPFARNKFQSSLRRS